MGEAKRRKHSDQIPLTEKKILSDLAKNPQKEGLGRMIRLFIYDNWHPEYLADIKNLIDDEDVPDKEINRIIYTELHEWCRKFNMDTNRDVVLDKKLMDRIWTSLTIVADLFNKKSLPVEKPDFSTCTMKDDSLTILHAMANSIYIYHHTDICADWVPV